MERLLLRIFVLSVLLFSENSKAQICAEITLSYNGPDDNFYRFPVDQGIHSYTMDFSAMEPKINIDFVMDGKARSVRIDVPKEFGITQSCPITKRKLFGNSPISKIKVSVSANPFIAKRDIPERPETVRWEASAGECNPEIIEGPITTNTLRISLKRIRDSVECTVNAVVNKK